MLARNSTFQHPSHESAPAASPYRLFAFRHDIRPDPIRLFASLFASSENAYWLDSSLHDDGAARFSYMGDSSGPRSRRIHFRADISQIEIVEKGATTTQHGDIFEYLEQDLQARGKPDAVLPFDFHGGYVGYFGYELKGVLQGKMSHSSATPDACWIFADRMVVLDHSAGDMWLLCLDEGEQPDPDNAQWLAHVVQAAIDATGSPAPEQKSATGQLTDLRWRHRPDEYRHLIERALELIRQGDTYEVCLTNQLSAKGELDPFAAYINLRQLNPSPYAAYLKAGTLSVLSGSPELFLSISQERVVTSKPIKGTARRDQDPVEDARLADELATSEKARSENLMIVDLLRNDLGRVCEIGSVQVPHLFHVESFASVHQLVSTITGTLGHHRSAFDCIRAAFPGGSMTGAPKVRTMAIIDELEAGPRGIYSGSLGYLSLSGSVRLNIVIRTIVIDGSDISMGSGGAIVAMSDPDEELDEVLLKLQAQLHTLRACGVEFDIDHLLREFPLISMPAEPLAVQSAQTKQNAGALIDSVSGETLFDLADFDVADRTYNTRLHASR
jgi:para-aminobenzoate synthetase